MIRPTDTPPDLAEIAGQHAARNPKIDTDVSPLSPQEIGSASRSCLVILALAAVILLLICVSWLARVLF